MSQCHISHYYLIVRLRVSFSLFKMNPTHIQKYNLSNYYWQQLKIVATEKIRVNETLGEEQSANSSNCATT